MTLTLVKIITNIRSLHIIAAWLNLPDTLTLIIEFHSECFTSDKYKIVQDTGTVDGINTLHHHHHGPVSDQPKLGLKWPNDDGENMTSRSGQPQLHGVSRLWSVPVVFVSWGDDASYSQTFLYISVYKMKWQTVSDSDKVRTHLSFYIIKPFLYHFHH